MGGAAASWVATALLLHGATDIDRGPKCLVIAYAPPCLLPLPSWFPLAALTPLACHHFAADVGLPASVSFTLGLAYKSAVDVSVTGALRFLKTYMAVVHVPQHYARAMKRRRRASLTFALGATLAAGGVAQVNPNLAFWCNHAAWRTPWVHRIAVGHLMCDIVTPNADVTAS